MDWQDRIKIDPKILGGKPVIKGTRLLVEFVIDLLAQGWPESEIIRNYPSVTHEDIAACLKYAASVLSQQPAEEKLRRRWTRIAVELAAAVGLLAFLAFRFLNPPLNSLTATPAPTVDPNIPVGKMDFVDFNYYADQVLITVSRATQPKQGTHYEAWLVTDDGKTYRDLGKITFNASGVGGLKVSDPEEKNFLQDYNQIQITAEPGDEAPTAQATPGGNATPAPAKPSGEVIYSSITPPKTLVHIRHLIVSFAGLPDQGPLIENFWYYSADYIDRSINGDDTDAVYKVAIKQAYDSGDEATLRKRTEEVINLIVGSQSDQYLDYDKDGTVDDPGDGYGSLPNGDYPGHIQATALHAQLAADAEDSTPAIRAASANVQICITNVSDWTNQLLPLALQLDGMTFGSEMEPIIKQNQETSNSRNTIANYHLTKDMRQLLGVDHNVVICLEMGFAKQVFPLYL